MSAAARLIAGRALAHEAAVAEIVPALAAVGIEPILFKGPATIRLLYDDANGRDSDDIDLLVAPDHFEPALAVLERHGFVAKFAGARASEHLGYEETVTRNLPLPVTIDLHRALALVPDGDALVRVLRRDARPLPVGGVTVSVPGDAACTLILALHVADHGDRSPRARHDLGLACERVDPTVWSEAAALADELGVRSELALGLSGHPGGSAVAARLGARIGPDSTGTEGRLRLRRRDGVARWGRLVLSAESSNAALGVLRDALVPSPAAMRLYYPDTAPGAPALAGAYVRRLSKFPGYSAAAARESGRGVWARLPGYLAGLRWSWFAVRRARAHLRSGGLDRVDLRQPPPDRAGTVRGIRHGLALARGSCLETSVVRRRWHLARGRDVAVVIGVRRDAAGDFGAHAWLEGDVGTPGPFSEIAAWPESAPRQSDVMSS